MRQLYTSFFYLALPFILLRLLWRSRHNKQYRQRWQERLGCIDMVKNPQVIWIHAVSVGETIAAIPLVKALLQEYPNHQIVMTSTTPTGSEQVKKLLKDKVIHSYLPYDLPLFIRHFLKRVHPQLLIIMETEIWPNLLHECRRQSIPVMLANARLSQRSYKNYLKIKSLMQETLKAYHAVAAQGPLDQQHFIGLGLDPEKTQMTGNLKFDMNLPEDLAQQGKQLRTEWQAENRPVLIAASTHHGEESIILDAFTQARKNLPNLLLVLVPRHPERFAEVAQLCEQSYQIAKRSTQDAVTPQTDIFLGDTVGELRLFYATSDIAFVGGSLCDVGGHNLLEPAALGIPVLTGPVLHNFIDISNLLIHTGGAKVVHNAKELADTVTTLFASDTERDSMGQKAKQAVEQNRGALANHLKWIKLIAVPVR